MKYNSDFSLGQGKYLTASLFVVGVVTVAHIRDKSLSSFLPLPAKEKIRFAKKKVIEKCELCHYDYPEINVKCVTKCWLSSESSIKFESGKSRVDFECLTFFTYKENLIFTSLDPR